MFKNKKIGLALSGGVALGAAHVGVLKALQESEINISYISGTSIGAFIAALYSFRVPVEEIEEIAVNLGWLDVSDFTLSTLGILSNKELGNIITERLSKSNIEDADIPLAIVATDIASGEKVIFYSGDVATAVTASTSIPGIFIPVEQGDRMLVDGGLSEFVPISPLKEMGAGKIIAVDLFANRTYYKPKNLVELLVNAFDIAIDNFYKSKEDVDTWILLELAEYSRFDTRQGEELVEEGYKGAKAALKNLN
jgi:NTE family protein